MNNSFAKIKNIVVFLSVSAVLVSCSATVGAKAPASADPSVSPAAIGAAATPETLAAAPASTQSGNITSIAPPPPPVATPGPYDVNVSINYTITLGDKVKDVDPNIIRAARQGMFSYDAGNARFAHYIGYNVSYDVEIFEVDQKDANTWEVRFWEKTPDETAYNTDGYSVVTVTKQQSGQYIGTIINPGGPMIRGDETY